MERVRNVMVQEISYYENRLRDWHLNINEKCDTHTIQKLIDNCSDTIKMCKKNNYAYLVTSLNEGDIKRYEVELFAQKLNYYLNNLRTLEIKMGYHVICFNGEDKNISIMKKDIRDIYEYAYRKNNISKTYILFHPKYKYMFNEILLDLRTISKLKQLQYVNTFVDILWIIEKVNKIWQTNEEKFNLENIVFNRINTIEKLQYQCEILDDIINIEENYRLIKKLLKKNTNFYIMNPYEEDTYIKLQEVIIYLSFFGENSREKNYE